MLSKIVTLIAIIFLALPLYTNAQIKLPKIKSVNDVMNILNKKTNTANTKSEKNDGDSIAKPVRQSQKSKFGFLKKKSEYLDIKPQDLNGKWTGSLGLNMGRDIEFEMRITANGSELSAIAEYKTAYGHMKYLLSGTLVDGNINFIEKEVLEQGPGNDLFILFKKKYTGGCTLINDKLQFNGTYVPDGQFVYQNKQPVPSATLIYGSSFKLIKVDEAKIAREFLEYVYTPDQNEEVYMRKMVIFFANNKYYNYSRKCNPATFRYYILSRDEKGMFTKVLGKYFEQTSAGIPVTSKDSVEILVQFDKGMPYRIGYPKDESLPEVTPLHQGEIGALEYPDEARQRVIDLFLADNKKRDEEFEENRKRSQAAIEKKLLEYGKFDCQACFEKTANVESYEYEVTDFDLKGDPFTVKKTGYNTIVTYVNKCNQIITVVGVKRVGTTNKGAHYVDISFSLKPKQQISFDAAGIGVLLGNVVNLTSLDAKIDPQYSQQYMRIVGKTKPIIK